MFGGLFNEVQPNTYYERKCSEVMLLPLAKINIKSTISSQPSQPSRVSSVCVPDRKQLGRVKRWREGEEGRVSVKEEGKEPRKVEKLLDKDR